MIYFDNAATTKPYPEVVDSFSKVSLELFGNSESNHAIGLKASRALEESRTSILKALKVEKTHSLIFTSGATEANNLALKGTAIRYKNRGKRILVSPVEHPSVYKPLEELATLFGFEVIKLPIDSFGRVNLDSLISYMDNRTILVSVMAVNNEIGSQNDIASIATILHKFPKCFFHVDATQAMGKVDLPYEKIDLLSFSSHKFGGLKGNGGLLYKKTMQFEPILAGGEQENGFRAGTTNVAGDVSTAKALEISLSNRLANYNNAKEIYDYLRGYFLSDPIQYRIHSDEVSDKQTPYVLNVGFLKKKASVIVEALSNRDVYVSSVSACSSKEAHASNVLLACGYSLEEASNSVRISFSSANTLMEAKQFVSILKEIMKEVIDR